MSILIHTAKCGADSDHLAEELTELRKIFLQNDYPKLVIDHIIANHGTIKSGQHDLEKNIIKRVAAIPYYGIVVNRLTRLLQRRKN